MDLRIHDDPGVFRALAEPFYGADTLRHTIALTVMSRMSGPADEQAPLMGTLHADDALVGVALRTPPWPLIVSGLPTGPEILAPFLTRWLEADPGLPGVSGPVENADAVAGVWARLTGGTSEATLVSRLFRLGELTPPVASGRHREATEDDLDLLVGWHEGFSLEARGFHRAAGNGRALLRRRFDVGDPMFLWEDGGRPVAWAAASTPVGGMSRIGPVFTPPEHREHGYGSAVTAAVSQHARSLGATDVILFADVTKPVPSSIYQKIGYRPVYDSTELEFVRLPSTS